MLCVCGSMGCHTCIAQVFLEATYEYDALMTWKPKSWLWRWTMTKNDQREVLTLDGNMGCYYFLAQVYLEMACQVILW